MHLWEARGFSRVRLHERSQKETDMLIERLAKEENRFKTCAEEATAAGRDAHALYDTFDMAFKKDPSFGTASYISPDPLLKRISDDFTGWDFAGKQGLEYTQKRDEVYGYFSANLRAFANIYEWEKYKKVYTIDPDFYRELVQTETIRCNFDLMTLVPFPAFYIDLSSVPLPHTSHYQDVQGILVNVRGKNRVDITIIDDNDIYGPQKMLATAPASWADCKSGKYRFVSVCIEEEEAQARIRKDNAFSDLGIRLAHSTVVSILDMHSPVFSEIVVFVIQLLMFLGSKTSDIVRREKPSGSSGGSNGTDTPIECWDVGVHYGEKIRLIERKRRIYGDIVVDSSADGQATRASRRRPRPYVRGAHWHSYWCGTDEARHIELRWLEPTFCNGTLDDVIISLNAVTALDAGGSGGEEAIADYLTRMRVPFDREYAVSIGGHSRRFDFRLEVNGRAALIEFDGEQHFRPVDRFGGQEAFRERRKADRDKTKWAKQHKLPLLRIRFDQAADIPELIDAFLDKPDVHRFNPFLSNGVYYDLAAG